MKTAEELFENGSTLIRDYSGHEQMLMNKGTFIEIINELQAPVNIKEVAIYFGDWIYNNWFIPCGEDGMFDTEFIYDKFIKSAEYKQLCSAPVNTSDSAPINNTNTEKE